MHTSKFMWYPLLLLLLLSGCQWKNSKVNLNGNQLVIQKNEGTVVIQPISPDAFEVKYQVSGTHQHQSYAIADIDSSITTTLTDNATEWLYATENLTAKINKESLAISYFYKNKPLTSEERGYFNNDSIEGFRMNLTDEEILMGGGERVLGMNRRGNRLRLYNRASYGYETHADLMYYSMPVVISSNKYMLIFDNAADGYLDLGATQKDILQFEAVGGRMSYIIVGADDWKQLPRNYTAVTGHQPMPPRWALGNISSRMGYHTKQQVEKVVDTYQKEDFPLDAMVLDLYWFGPDLKGHMGNLEWDLEHFPQPKAMMKNLKDKGVNTVLITEPFILNTSGKFDECTQQNLLGTDTLGNPFIYDFYFGTTGLIDIFKPEAQKWFWNIYRKHSLEGVAGWWGDLGEPEVHPDELQHVNGAANTVHNAYGHEWAKLIYDGYHKDFPEKRPVILMRAGFAGSQRYGMIPWSGDVNRTWGGLKSQVEISLQMGMQGLAYMHSDLGGFAGNYKDAEMYTRWLQYGVFQPVFRTHAQEDVPPEPIYWDAKTKSIVRKFIKLRYALTPYLYTMAYENSTNGTPLMRPLFFADNNPEFISETNAYLWGDNFLVAPVTEKGAKKWTLPLPNTGNWYNFFTNEVYKGGQSITVPVNINTIPVFVKGGAFIPMAKPANNMDAYSTQEFDLHYYFDNEVSSSSAYMYEDDGASNQTWLHGEFEKVNFNASVQNKKLSFEISRNGTYSNQPQSRTINLIVHNSSKQPQTVTVNDKEVQYQWNAKTKELRISFGIEKEKVDINIQ